MQEPTTCWLVAISGAVAKEAEIRDADDKLITTGTLATGYEVKNNGRTYTVVKLGDVNGDGKLTPADSTAVLRYYVGLDKLSNAKKSAADTNRDGKYTPADSTVILRTYVGLQNIDL